MTPTEHIKFQEFQITIKRDDLYPIVGGGNKGRKVEYIFRNIDRNSKPVIITNGGLQSNHARVCAILSAQRGYECHLVLHSEQESDSIKNPTGNYLISLITGAHIHHVAATNIAEKIESIRSELIKDNKNPFIIPGGAHCLEGALAYSDMVDELKEQPDYIFLASGTGATQAGLLAGLDRKSWDTEVIGISVARGSNRAASIINDSYDEVRQFLHITSQKKRPVNILDEWTFGGYEKYDHSLISLIKNIARDTGIILDYTYTGKAFYGMIEVLKRYPEMKSKKILFLHTGGLMNLASSETSLFNK